MAGISTGGGGHGGKKSVDSEIPLVPFIDLLLVCVMFLLVTAVWNQLARIDANQNAPGSESLEEQPPEDPVLKLILRVEAEGYAVGLEGNPPTRFAKKDAKYDIEALRKELETQKKADPSRTDIIISPDDEVSYNDIITTMDLVVGMGFPDLALADKQAAMYFDEGQEGA